MNLEECIWLAASRGQRETEGSESPGIEAYRLKGCYDSCDGLRKSCTGYTPLRYLLPYSNANKDIGKTTLDEKELRGGW